ncbi:MAG TPA: glycosyltransferase [Solirubrobacteraceae bacterium]
MDVNGSPGTTLGYPVVGEVVRSYLPRSETFTYTQIRSLRRFRPVVLTWMIENDDEFDGVPVVRVTPDAPAPVRAARGVGARLAGARNAFDYRLANSARQQGCALLHAHFGWMGVASVYAQRRLSVPLVTTFHAADIISDRDDLRAGYPALFRQGTLFTAVGPRMAGLLADRGCPPERIRLVKLGIDIDRIRCVPRRPRPPLVLLQVARLTPKKGVALTLRAFAAARDELGASELWIVGDGPLRGELEQLADELGVAGSVKFLGTRDHQSTLELMTRAHVGLQPSLTAPSGDIEGTPTVLLEMQAAGLPIVATAHADTPSIVATPEDLVPENDVEALAGEIVRVAGLSGPVLESRIQRARRFVETEHALSRAREAIEQVYDEALRIGAPDG